MKILGIYLPQYHEIPENNEWWGKGYTEWNAVKQAKKLFQNHSQPRIPLNSNYYDLVKQGVETWKWQADLANRYGIYGFCIYHYWFEGKQLLERPMEILRDHPEIKINYSICWANETWRRNWYQQEQTVLMEQTYGDEEAWTNHYKYLSTFFRDERYIKINNKPVVQIYKSKNIEQLPQMAALWNELAKEDGFDGVALISALTVADNDDRDELFDYYYDFEPGYTLKNNLKFDQKLLYYINTAAKKMINKFSRRKLLEHIIDIRMIYDRIEKKDLQKKCFPGTFPQWDNTPRRGNQGLCYINSSPEVFYRHLRRLSRKYEEAEFLYLNAWNEWGEGAYLEPDTVNKFGFLKAIKKVQEKKL